MTLKIDKGIPPPPERRRRNKYPFRDLDPGDSFFVPDTAAKTMGSSVSHARKRYGIRLVTRTENGGVRVWRLPDDETGA